MKYIILDVREQAEFSLGHVEGALNIPVGSLSASSSELKNLPKDSSIIVYCQSGGRAGLAQEKLHNIGFTNVHNGINQPSVESNL